jgi:two-component system, cell cycle response regulator
MGKELLRILIIDDSPEDREICRRYLLKDNNPSYVVDEAENAQEGLQRLQSETFDCLLLDNRLPDMEGLDVLKELSNNKQLPKIPVIFLTGQGNEAIAVEALKTGAFDYLIKGQVSRDLLLRTIRYAVETKKAENALWEYYSFLEILLDTIPNPIFFKDTEGVYIGCNKSYESYLGLPRDQIIGKTFFDLAPKELADFHNRIDQQLFQHSGVQVYEKKALDAGGNLQNLIIHKATFSDMDGRVKGLVGIQIDISDKIRIEENLQKAKEELELNIKELKKANQLILDQQKSVIEEERLKLLLQLSGATAHELNQPLTTLIASIELMRIDEGNAEQMFEHLDRIEKAGHQIASIVNKIQKIRHKESTSPLIEPQRINFNQETRILSIEDKDSDYEKISSLLKQETNLIISRVRHIAEAIDTLKTGQVDLVFLDYVLPDGNGSDFLGLIRKEGLEIPIIVITGQGNEVVASQLIQEGAYDYIPKPMLSEKSLSRSIINALEKHRLKRDVKLAMEKMAEMSSRDELTGLYNRRYFMEALEREKARAKRYTSELSLCLIDLDHFKQINDTHSHLAGDKVLSEIGMMIRETIRESDLGCRYGGEEFAVILPNTSPEKAVILTHRLLEKVSDHVFDYDSLEFGLTVSVGVSSYNSALEEPETEVLKRADLALYQAKTQGRNRIVTI